MGYLPRFSQILHSITGFITNINTSTCEGDNQNLTSSEVEHVQAYGYQRSWSKTYIVYTAYILSLSCLKLFFYWFPRLYLYATYNKCALSQATKILIIDNYKENYKTYYIENIHFISVENLSQNKYFSSIIDVDQELIKKLKNANLKIKLENGSKFEAMEYRAFWCKKQCYIWDSIKCEFSKLASLDKHINCSDLTTENNGLAREEQTLRRIVYGNNEILVPVQTIGELLLLEILSPFYIFQIFTLVMWLYTAYYYYCIAIIILIVYSIVSSIVETKKNQKKLRKTVALTETVKVLRNTGEFQNISSAELVPGDILELPKDKKTMVCDAVLLAGTCVVNEAALTGESVPVAKTPLQPWSALYDSKKYSHNTLFCGTIIIQTKNYDNKPVLAKVIRTGLQTNKGTLFAAILYPLPTDFKFEQDMNKVLKALVAIGICGFIYTFVIANAYGKLSENPVYIAVNAICVVTFVAPLALPALKIVTMSYGRARLQKKQIYCTNTKAINVSGSINCVCFDKTGTLTEDSLNIMGVIPNENNKLDEPQKSLTKLKNSRIFEGMLVCHSLAIINDSLVGDTLELQMFESTEWTLEEPATNTFEGYEDQTIRIVKPPVGEDTEEYTEIGIVQQYQFSSELRRMSVIAQSRGSDKLFAYCKGSPETILSLSLPGSYPDYVANILQKYTEMGYRVIALGRSDISHLVAAEFMIQSMPRDMIEKDLEFLGLIIFENNLKSATPKVIEELREANIRTVMVTGDNIETAIRVAKECGIILSNETVVSLTVTPGNNIERPELVFTEQHSSSENVETITRLKFIKSKKFRLVLTGETWQLLREHYFDILPKICVSGAVFARMASDQKRQLVIELTQLDYYVLMCGDGANDCEALKAAHVGISLSEAESSIASAFTSLVKDISSVKTVIQEGRAALVTSFGITKFMIAYALTEFIFTLIMYSVPSDGTNFEYLFIDLGLSFNLGFFFCGTAAYTGRLAKEPPLTKFVSLVPVFSLVTQIIVVTAFQIYVLYEVRLQDWYTPPNPKVLVDFSCSENYSLFCLNIFQNIILAILFSRGKPYRGAIYTNYAFTISLMVTTAVCIYITLGPAQWIVDLLQLTMPPVFEWRLIIIGLAFLNLIVCFCIEELLVQRIIEQKIRPKMENLESSKKPYLKIEDELEEIQFNFRRLVNGN